MKTGRGVKWAVAAAAAVVVCMGGLAGVRGGVEAEGKVGAKTNVEAKGVSGAEVERWVAVTFDDLPGPTGGTVQNDVGTLREMTRKLLAAIVAAKIPAVGFVNEGKLEVAGEGEAGARARRELLGMWTAAGLELGNHTYSHRSLNTVALGDFQGDVERGEPVTRGLEEKRGGKLRWFRHPFLHTGRELEKKRAFEAWLAGRGYRVAAVTMDNDDYVYSAVYAEALRKKDAELARRTGEDYVRYMEETTDFWEKVEEHVAGRRVKHVLLVHANAINADYFAQVAEMLRRRGYKFVTLEEAMGDAVYGMEDTYTGAWGISWLHRWGLTAGKTRLADPDPPGWVMKKYEERERQ